MRPPLASYPAARGANPRGGRRLAPAMGSRTRYAKGGDLHIAYQVVGDGPVDIVYVPTWIGQIELLAEEPTIAAFLDRLYDFARVVSFDRRGSGLSDPWQARPRSRTRSTT